MTYLQLQPHVSYGMVAQRPVFLDLARDRYLALPPPIERAFQDVRVLEDPVLPEGSERDLLLDTGLFRTGSLRGRGLNPAAAPPISASLLDETDRPRRNLPAILRVRASVGRARRQLADRSLHEIVDAVRESRHGARPEGTSAAAEDAARQFLAVRALVPAERRCLLDALALLDWLGDDASHARLVFGVRLEPFAAHCWLQTDRLLLTDAADAIEAFVPVLSV
jgi:hypothetical protein